MTWGCLLGAGRGSMFVHSYSAASNVSVPARDFSAWLQRTVAPHDTVHLVIDAAGA